MARAFVEEIGWELPSLRIRQAKPTSSLECNGGLDLDLERSSRLCVLTPADNDRDRQRETFGNREVGLIDAQGTIKHRHADTGAGDSIDFSQVLRRARTA